MHGALEGNANKLHFWVPESEHVVDPLRVLHLLRIPERRGYFSSSRAACVSRLYLPVSDCERSQILVLYGGVFPPAITNLNY